MLRQREINYTETLGTYTEHKKKKCNSKAVECSYDNEFHFSVEDMIQRAYCYLNKMLVNIHLKYKFMHSFTHVTHSFAFIRSRTLQPNILANDLCTRKTVLNILLYHHNVINLYMLMYEHEKGYAAHKICI